MWPNPQETAYLVTFTVDILNWKLYFFLYSVGFMSELSINPFLARVPIL